MQRARGLWRAGVAATLGGSRALSGAPGAGSGGPGASSGGPGGGLSPEAEADPALLRASSPELARRLRGLALVRGGFVSEGEAAELLREVEPGLRRGRYQNDHWDRVRGPGGEEVTGGRGSTEGHGLVLRSKVRVNPAVCPARPSPGTGRRSGACGGARGGRCCSG